jgi:hypothetical protein
MRAGEVERQNRRILRAGSRCIAFLAGALLACSGGPWVSAAPVELGSSGIDPDLVVARCVTRAQDLGYSIDAIDYEGGSLRLVAMRSDAVWLGIRAVPRTSSWLLVQVEDDRSVTVRAYGDLVREEDARMHPELRAEMDWLARELESAIRGDPPPSKDEPSGSGDVVEN